MDEEVKKAEAPTGLRVLGTQIDGTSLYIDVASDSRDELVNKGRTFALAHTETDPKFVKWSNAGVEKSSSPVAFDPNDEKNDPYSPTRRDVKWHYRQTLRLTRSPI